MKIFYFTLVCLFVTLQANAQAFKNVNELISLSRKSPSDIERKLADKGFQYIKTKDKREFLYNATDGALLNYELSPRMIEYVFKDRQFYLDAYSYLEKSNYSVSKGELIAVGTGEKHTGVKFTNAQNAIYLLQLTEDSKVKYEILVYPTIASNGTVGADKKDFGYASLYAAILTPKGVIAEIPTGTNTVEQSFTGRAGIGAKRGWEFGIAGIAGLYGVNKKLPYFVDFGIHLKLMGGFQAYELAAPDYKYKNFVKVGGGGGPSFTVSPWRNQDLHFSVYYDFLPAAILGGTVTYIGDNANYSDTYTRPELASFSLIQVFGFEIKYESISVGIESSKYIDSSKYDRSYTTSGNTKTETFTGAMAMNHLALKLGFCF